MRTRKNAKLFMSLVLVLAVFLSACRTTDDNDNGDLTSTTLADLMTTTTLP